MADVTTTLPPVVGPDVVLGRARLLDLSTGEVGEPLDLHVVEGRISRRPCEESCERVDLDGGIVMPGLWDAHVHMGQWALRRTWLDLSDTGSAAEVVQRLAEGLASHEGDGVLVGYGFRDSRWPDRPSDQALDAATGERPVVALSGDLHSAWANRAALRRLGLDHHASGHLTEEDAFEATRRANQVDDQTLDALVAEAAREAAASGLVGIVDFEMVDGVPVWQRRMAQGFDSLVVRTAAYPQWLHLAAERRLATGDLLDETGLLAMGPLKVVGDGSLTARTAWCCEPYAAAALGAADPEHPRGAPNFSGDELVHLMATATAQGLECAIHAIGDAAVAATLDAFATTGARGSIEHAQLTRPEDQRRMAELGIRASVQPAHLLDDRDAMDALWPDRTQDAFPLASLAAAGVHLALGSDAPVANLDPWLAIEAAVRRTIGEREPWHPDQSLTLSQALMASCRGVSSLVSGAEADLVVLDANPFAIPADALHAVRPRMTMLGGRRTHG